MGAVMLRDAFLPATFPHSREPVFRAVDKPGIRYSAARWTPEALGKVVAALAEGEAALRAIPDDELLAAWGGTGSTFLRTVSLGRRGGRPPPPPPPASAGSPRRGSGQGSKRCSAACGGSRRRRSWPGPTPRRW